MQNPIILGSLIFGHLIYILFGNDPNANWHGPQWANAVPATPEVIYTLPDNIEVQESGDTTFIFVPQTP